jgi:hypothetical protein
MRSQVGEERGIKNLFQRLEPFAQNIGMVDEKNPSPLSGWMNG